ncbi:PAS domain S-box protein [Methanosarcina sp.]|uniref:PAS domain S-box protein n=1 Tax=Methanosarcina sp. TaxID=2213 RepID=UPI003C764361
MSSKLAKGQEPISNKALLDENRALKDEVQSLRARLEEAEELKRAISEGDLDALVIHGPEGELVFTLDSADRAYRVLVETMNEGTVTLACDGTILYSNRQFANLLKMSPQAIVGKSIYRFIAPESATTFKAILEHEVGMGEINLLGKEGATLPVYLSISSLEAEGSPNAWCLVVTDLTEQKKNEETLAAELLARSIIEQAAEAIIVCDISGRIIRFSNAASRICRCDPTFQRFEDIIDLRFSEGTDNGKSIFPVSSALKGFAILGLEATLELNCQRLNLLLNSGPLRNTEGKIVGCVATLTDITERKLAEEALRESEEKYRNIIETANEGIWIVDPEARTTYANQKMAEMLGCTQEEMIGKSTRDFTDEEGRAISKRNMKKGEQGINESHEFKLIRKDGSPLWTLISAKSLFDKDGRFIGSMNMLTDITGRKKAEAELQKTLDNLENLVEERTMQLKNTYKSLKESEKGLAEAQEMAHLGSWDHNVLTGEVHWSDEVYRIFGCSPQEFGITYDLFLNYIHPDDRDYVDQAIKKALNGEPYNIDYKIVSADGTEHIVISHGEVIFDEGGSPARIRGIIQDITERKQEEHRIHRYNHILEGINQIFSNVIQEKTEEDLGNTCLSIALEITGSQIGFVGEVGADGLLHDIAISDMGWEQCTMYDKTGHRRPPGDFILHGLYGCVIDTGKSFFTNDPMSYPGSIGLPQGHPPLTSFLGVPLITEGKTKGILSVANREGGYSREQQEDLAGIAPAVAQALQRKKSEEALEEIERIRIKEIHHRIKNNLQVISSLLSLEAERFSDAKILETFRESQNRIASMALIHEELYKGREADALDFGAYLQKLTAELFTSYNLGNDNIDLKMDLEQVYLDMDTAIPLGIIVNELISNSLKHAFPAGSEGEIYVSLCRTETFAAGYELSDQYPDCTQKDCFQYVLTVTDNGKGIPEEIDFQSSDSLGLQLVNILVEQIDGCIELRRNSGTQFVIWFWLRENEPVAVHI